MAHDVFISYSSKDKTIADAVCARLEARGIRCWIAPRDVRPGAPYGEEIIDGIQSARVMVLVLSGNANASPHIPKEVERAVSHGVPVIPLRVEAVLPAKSLDYFISSVHWLDAITPPLEQHLESLANTIRTLLQGAKDWPAPGQTVPLQTAPSQTAPLQSVPSQASEPRVSGAIKGAKPTWMFVAIGVAILLAAGAAWFFWPKPTDNGGGLRGSGNVPTRPDNRGSGSGGGGLLAAGRSGSDPIVGCWHWFNNVQVAINSDGTMNAASFTAHWRLVDAARHVYEFSWPEAVDTLALSADGRTISGGNQYGVPTNATRVIGGADIVGAWRWYNGVTVTILPNGTFSAGTTGGRWQVTGQGRYALTWPGPIDTVALSSDRRRVNGSNQYGFHISGVKTGVCGGR